MADTFSVMFSLQRISHPSLTQSRRIFLLFLFSKTFLLSLEYICFWRKGHKGNNHPEHPFTSMFPASCRQDSSWRATWGRTGTPILLCGTACICRQRACCLEGVRSFLWVLRCDSSKLRGMEKSKDSNAGVAQGYVYGTGLFCVRKHRGLKLLGLPADTSHYHSSIKKRSEKLREVWEPNSTGVNL